MSKVTKTGGRNATGGVIAGRWAISIGNPETPAPSGFNWRALTSLAELESGHTPSRRQPEYWDGDIPWVGIRDATGNHGKRISDTRERVTDLGIRNSSARVLPANTVCLSRTASVGYVVMMGSPMATSQDFVNWVCGESLDPYYLKYILILEQESIRRFSHGTTHQTMYYPEAKALHVCVPVIEEQRRIVRVLGGLDELIDANEGIVRAVRELSTLAYRRAKARSTGKVFLGKVAAVNQKQTRAKKDGHLTYLDIASFSDGVINWPDQIEWSTAPSRARRLAEPGATLWSTVRPGRRAHALLVNAPPNLVVSTGLAVLTPTEIGPAELFAATDEQEFVDYLVKRAEGTAYPAVRGDVFEEARIAQLSGKESSKFEEQLWPLWQMAGELEAENRDLKRVRDDLLPLLLSGKIRALPAAYNGVDDQAGSL